MQEKELKIVGGSLYYEKKQESIIITGLQGMGSQLSIPGEIEGLPVREIGKKAFLSKKNLRVVVVPDTVTEIGDWAFAYCDNLELVTLLGTKIEFGKAVFLDCNKLSRLHTLFQNDANVTDFYKDYAKDGLTEQKSEAVAALLAAAVTTMQAPYLLDIEEAGNKTWLAKWDARMLEILNRPDEEGFSKQILCGEEDYGSTDMNAFLKEKRKNKVRLLLLRCLFDVGLDEKLRKLLEQYLREHTKGCINDETWQVILEDYGNNRAYYQLFTELSCLTEENFDTVIADIGEEYPEMKAYFMRYKEEKIGYQDFFGELEL